MGAGVQPLSSQAALRKEGGRPRENCGSDSRPQYQGRDSAEDPPPFSGSLLPRRDWGSDSDAAKNSKISDVGGQPPRLWVKAALTLLKAQKPY